ncbi:MAG: hypothetical protein QM813_18360 [Verrucomicrobiota bacterium]
MIELDPEIMKRSLPPNIHAAIDQVTANVNVAVDELVNRFVKNAEQAVARIEKGVFTADITKALEQAKQELQADLKSMDARLQTVAGAVAKANALIEQAGNDATALISQLEVVSGAANDLKTELAQFRTKVDTFASKSGGFIASAALKSVGVV